jgi:hypothetical protein
MIEGAEDFEPTIFDLLQSVLILIFNVVQALVVFVILGSWVVARIGFHQVREFARDI